MWRMDIRSVLSNQALFEMLDITRTFMNCVAYMYMYERTFQPGFPPKWSPEYPKN